MKFLLPCAADNLCELAQNEVKGVLPVIGLLFGSLMDSRWLYIVEKNTGPYVGITTDLENRMRQHGQPIPLYYEGPISRAEALKRERTLKGWSRKKKLELIEKTAAQER